MDWEEKVQTQLQVVDEKLDKIEHEVSRKIDEGIELTEKPSVEIATSVLNIVAGTTLTAVAKKGVSKNNSVGKNLLASTAVVIGATSVALATAKLAANCFKLKKETSSKKLEKEIEKLIED